MPSFLDRIRLLPSALIALTLSHALAAASSTQKTASSDSSPLSIPPSQQWDGIDGAWSSFTVRMGTPAQDVRTFVSWNAYQTWGVIPQGCQAADDYDACAQARGGIFNQTASTTFQLEGLYLLGISEQLGYNGDGYFGYDVVGLGPDAVILPNTTAVGFALDDFYLGVLGINPKPTNFTTLSNGAPSYISQLKELEHIPSISFGYTAGAQYRTDSVSDPYGSLTLGGFDKSKFYANDLTWTFAQDNSRDIVVAVQSIHTPSRVESSPVATLLLPNPIYMYLDATVPQIWLPIESCYVFEYEFGLVYDDTTDLYLVNNTYHQQLVERNASITFQLAIGEHGGNIVNIELPYAAFDLTANATYQGLQNDSFYFPLRRALNESQYTLGRAFFQEAYISVDYESQTFNVSQRAWESTSTQNIVAIPPFTETSSSAYPGVTMTSSSHKLSGGAIAGLVIGVLAFIVLTVLAIYFISRRRRTQKARAARENEKLTAHSDTASDHATSTPPPGNETLVIPKAELPGSSPASPAPVASGALSSTTASSSPIDVRHPHNLTFPSSREPQSPFTDPDDGTGTHSSADSTSRGTGSNYGSGVGTLMSLVSPLSPTDSCEADGREMMGPSELAGDMPTVKEKDGRSLTEKEAMAWRERVYNGVDDVPPVSAGAVDNRDRRLVGEGEMVREVTGEEERPRGLRRAFSFEEGKREGTEDLRE